MTLYTMSFAPSLPNLPSYPRHLVPSRSASPAPYSTSPSKKKARPSGIAASTPSYAFSHPLTPSATDSDDDDGLMAHSIYSDRDYRSSLVGPRKRGWEESDDGSRSRPGSSSGVSGGGGKRRILDVVGGTLGGVLRGAWEIFRPRIPFYGGATQEPQEMEVERNEEMSSFAAPRASTAAPAWEPWGTAPAATTYYNTTTPVEPTPLPTPTASAAPVATDNGMSARWVMVSPTEPARKRSSSIASSPSTRHRRVISATKRRGLKPPPRTPPLGSQSPFTFPTPASGGKRHKKGSSRDDDLEMDEDMRRFNERLKAMIREGKEALGAKVEVLYDDDEDIDDY